jgi:hypothetical protein
MEALLPGHFWKTPFIWEPGCPEPSASAGLRFVEADPLWLAQAVSAVMANSLDESDQRCPDLLRRCVQQCTHAQCLPQGRVQRTQCLATTIGITRPNGANAEPLTNIAMTLRSITVALCSPSVGHGLRWRMLILQNRRLK